MPNPRPARLYVVDDATEKLHPLTQLPAGDVAALATDDCFDLHLRHLWIDNLMPGGGQEEVAVHLTFTSDRAGSEGRPEYRVELVAIDHVKGKRTPASRLVFPLGTALARGLNMGRAGCSICFKISGQHDADAVEAVERVLDVVEGAPGLKTERQPKGGKKLSSVLPVVNLTQAALGPAGMVLPILSRAFSVVAGCLSRKADVVDTSPVAFAPRSAGGDQFRLQYRRYALVQADRIGNKGPDDVLSAHSDLKLQDGALVSEKGPAHFNFAVFEIERSGA